MAQPIRVRVTKPLMKSTWNPGKMNRKIQVNKNKGNLDEYGNQVGIK